MTNSQTAVSPPPETERKTPWAWTVSTFFGVGLAKPGPGTWGSVAAVLLWGAIAWLFHPTPNGLLLVVFIGVAVSIACRRTRSDNRGPREQPSRSPIRGY